MAASSSGKGGKKNFMWGALKRDFLVAYLAECAKNGEKKGKSFDRPIYIKAAEAVAASFNDNCKGENTESWMKTAKRFAKIMQLRETSGWAWDDDLKMIKVDRVEAARYIESIGFLGPARALLGLIAAKTPTLASAWLAVAVGLKSFSHSGFLVNFQEVAPEYAGVLHGMSNTAGTFAAIIGTVGAGFFVEKMGSFRGFLLLTSVLYFISALIFLLFATGEHVNFDGSVQ